MTHSPCIAFPRYHLEAHTKPMKHSLYEKGAHSPGELDKNDQFHSKIYTKRSIASQIKNPIGVQQAFGGRSDQSYKSLVGVYNV
jgi:hypothetical protein